MRTTVDVPDELYHAAKVTAAQRRITMRELFLSGLKCVMAAPAESSPSDVLRNEGFLDALDASNSEPVHPLGRRELYEERIRP